MLKTWIVTCETYLRQVKSWSFFFMVLGPFLMLGLTVGITYVSSRSNASSQNIAVIAETPALRQNFIAENPSNIDKQITTVTAAKKALHQNHLAGYLVLRQTDHQLRADYHGPKALGKGLKAQVQNYLAQTQQVTNYQQAKLTAKQQRLLQRTPKLTQHIAASTGTANLAKTISFWLIVTMIYIILVTYASITAQEIASDKGTKIMEIIFSSTTAVSYFVGKICGILLVILTQIAIYLLGGWAIYSWALSRPHLHAMWTQYHTLVTAILHNLLNLNLLYLLVGVVLFTLVAAYSGAVVAKAEDASKAAQPVVMLGMVGFFATFPFQNNLDALPVKIMSYVPFLSSYFMPMRIINGTVSLGTQWLSLGLALLTVAALAGYIGRKYQHLMLQTDSHSVWQHLFQRH
ncbi:ABC transporter permease [Levilactobacillus zymae]|uniref:ABC transporter permease n=1 Tax=Levilactobacillus zymae TaxID=267363 RepID=A0ABQ0WV10_9LACO|nr:ABC transporter permease [Levilactobacillus zymae]KRL11209.1 ABC-type Na+ efflux pump, permease component [Levilactobacillus zymae DSM 19395]QFR60105.1 ABC transporter permease [Levilactobacillus zymae]GEO71458.1 ABC transporter permease [Levilactobacillus zymae]